MMIKRLIFGGILLALLVIGIYVAVGSAKNSEQWYQESRELYYGIPVQVRFYPPNEQLSKQVWSYLESIDPVFNDYKSESEISAINRRKEAGEVTLSPMLADAFGKAIQAFKLSEGVFDITCAPIRNLWRQASKQGTLPSDAEVAAVREQCGLNRVELSGNQLKLSKAGFQFDFGGIVKGMCADHVVELLKAGGVERALVQIGGETAAFGLSPKKRPFRIGIQHPEARGETWSVIQDPGTGISASTSGNYENPILVNGQEFYHIMDPRTGYPAKTQVLSVSIAFPQTGKNWVADAFSTTGVLLGPEKTFEIIKPFGGEALFLLKKDGMILEVESPGWKRFK
jgi:thiamine biosynthesis lipoprotein